MKQFLILSKIPEDRAATIAQNLVDNGVDTRDALAQLSDQELKDDIGISVLGDRAKIRALLKGPRAASNAAIVRK
jgi:hypothetical protein